jgi:hypothetical protein
MLPLRYIPAYQKIACLKQVLCIEHNCLFALSIELTFDLPCLAFHVG